MTDKSTPTKKELSTNDKISNNQSTSTNIQNQDISQNQSLNLLNPNENFQNKSVQNFTFKIIKRRAPWSKKEDEAIIELVNKFGTSNWTIIANEMAQMYKSKHRNGKQCRERWHNHLDPIVNKNNWTEEEENILFNKHLEYGNKWSDISKYLPGRTDNSIKNHFYSKLRKFIRKILKQINKENLLKNNGIDYYKYNSDKVYKLLKKYKVTYKNVTKDTILELIIATEKNQKGKIMVMNEENKKLNNTDANIVNIGNRKEVENSPFSLDNNLIKNSKEKLNRNNSGNKNNNKTIFGKKGRLKSKVKNNQENNGDGANESALKKDKKIFKSNIVTKFKPITDINNKAVNEEKNLTINNNNFNDNAGKKQTGKYKKKLNKIQNDKDNKENNNNENEMNNTSKKLTINPEFVEKTYKCKKRGKSKKEKEDENKKVLNKKRRRKKRRKVSISLSTPENKKTQISRIMPGRKYIFGFGKKIPIDNRNSRKNSKNKLEIRPEDFDPLINEVEFIREGLSIYSKSTVVVNKSLLTEKIFPDMNYEYKPNINLNLTFPLSPKVQQYPSNISKKKLEENNFNEKNIMVGLPTPMGGYFEPQISPMNINNLMMIQPPSTKNVYNVDLGYENNFLRQNVYTPKGFFNPSNTPKKEINLHNKILIQNTSNISGAENNIQENNKKPPALNMEFIENYNNENTNGYTFFGGNENIGTNIPKQIITSPANIFNLSPTSPFIPVHL